MRIFNDYKLAEDTFFKEAKTTPRTIHLTYSIYALDCVEFKIIEDKERVGESTDRLFYSCIVEENTTYKEVLDDKTKGKVLKAIKSSIGIIQDMTAISVKKTTYKREIIQHNTLEQLHIRKLYPAYPLWIKDYKKYRY